MQTLKHMLLLIVSSVDGGYSSWGQWSSCSVTCGGGTRSRSRTCTNPPPQFGGKDCSGLGSSSESDACERQCCSGGKNRNISVLKYFLRYLQGTHLLPSNFTEAAGYI